MPELPEVQTIVNDLQTVLLNKKIIQLEIIDERLALLKKYQHSSKLLNQTISKISRRAKHLVFSLANNYYLVFHLKMTGQLIWSDSKKPSANSQPNKSTRAILKFSNQSQILFNDTRKFGWIKLMSEKDWQAYQKNLGLEPLSVEFTLAFLVDLFKKHPKSKLKTLLLDQHYLVGLGNIYVDESLFAAKILPNRLASSLKSSEIKSLYDNIKEILTKAIIKRGTSFSDYRDGRGQLGNFSKYLKVYGRASKPCLICKNPIQKTKLNGRGTHFCPICQK